MIAPIIQISLAGGKMAKIVTNPTSTTQWQTLVVEASQLSGIRLTEELESYLVFLLMRFTDSAQIAHKAMGIEFLTSINRVGSLRSIALRDVGDQCLLYSGLFPGRANKRRVRISYYVNLGKTAYFSLADTSKFPDNNLFAMLGEKFVGLMDILQSMREIHSSAPILDPIQAAELWHDTGSAHALQVLQQFTHGKPIDSIEISKYKH